MVEAATDCGASTLCVDPFVCVFEDAPPLIHLRRGRQFIDKKLPQVREKYSHLEVEVRTRNARHPFVSMLYGAYALVLFGL